MTTTPPPSELGPYKPVSDAVVLAALDRAQRHSTHGYDRGVLWSDLAEHLGFVHSAPTTFKLRPRVSRLRAASLVEHRKASGFTLWRLTSDGRKQLAKARQKREDLTLPEAPQHRLWREAQATAAERIDGLRAQMRGTLSQASKLLDSDGGDSDAWFDLRSRFVSRCERLGAATYSLREWREPDEGHADLDDTSERHSDSRRNLSWQADEQDSP